MIKSPIFYMGNKERLIKRGLIELFPKNINMFLDLFCGCGVVSLNVNSKDKILNDTDINIINLIKYFKDNTPQDIINQINNLIEEYNMPTFSTDTRVYKGDRGVFKERYNKLRKDYNSTKDISLLYMLNIFSNCHMLRFNSQNEFNMPMGNSYFSDKCKNNVLNNNYKDVSNITNLDFREYINYNFKENDFVYLDPPYFNTTATYNEGGWLMKDEMELLEFCDELNNRNIKFALSNIFENKGIVNTHLIEWCNKNNYRVHYFDNFTYYSLGRGSAKTLEVLIINY
jgi:DNA adenine methylase Dam